MARRVKRIDRMAKALSAVLDKKFHPKFHTLSLTVLKDGRYAVTTLHVLGGYQYPWVMVVQREKLMAAIEGCL